jgi:predicted DNA-binding transcriptional regulator YafY
MTPKERTIQILLRLLSAPYRYTRRDLEDDFGVKKDALEEYFKAFRSSGLELDCDKPYHRYAILPDRQFKELKYLQPLSDSDKAKIGRALDLITTTKDKLYLQNKLDSLYDFQQLGLRALRRPALERIERLAKAQQDGIQVVLENYRSRSNNIRNRIVEPFHVDPEKDTLQAYDIEAQDSRHFRLSRIERVQLSDTPWQFQSSHRVKITDVFRIADNQQVQVHLSLDVFAYNSLTEEFPLTLTYLQAGSAPNTWDFQCAVNHDFKGILNFIMANAEHVEVIFPAQLRERIFEEAEKILKKFQ